MACLICTCQPGSPSIFSYSVSSLLSGSKCSVAQFLLDHDVIAAPFNADLLNETKKSVCGNGVGESFYLCSDCFSAVERCDGFFTQFRSEVDSLKSRVVLRSVIDPLTIVKTEELVPHDADEPEVRVVEQEVRRRKRGRPRKNIDLNEDRMWPDDDEGKAGERIPLAKALIACSLCGEQFKHLDTLRTHKVKVHGEQKQFSCEICGREYCTSVALYNHKKMFHPITPKTRVCAECGIEVPEKNYYNHVHNKHRKKEKVYSCDICGVNYKYKPSLQKHQVKEHQIGNYKPKSYEIDKICSECGRAFKADELYRAHMFLKHGIEVPGLKKRECPHCSEVFYVKKKLEAHVMLHSGERKYTCDDCDFSSRFSGNLVKHRRRVHGIVGIRGAKRAEEVREFLEVGVGLREDKGPEESGELTEDVL